MVDCYINNPQSYLLLSISLCIPPHTDSRLDHVTYFVEWKMTKYDASSGLIRSYLLGFALLECFLSHGKKQSSLLEDERPCRTDSQIIGSWKIIKHPCFKPLSLGVVHYAAMVRTTVCRTVSSLCLCLWKSKWIKIK